MPCNDEGGAIVVDRTDYRQIKFVSAALCALMSYLDNPKKYGHRIALRDESGAGEGLLDHINWTEAGITRKQFDRWWREHKKEDRERRKREKKERDEREAHLKKRQQALAKLSPEERIILGVEDEGDDL